MVPLAHHNDAPLLGVNWYYVASEGRVCGDGSHVAHLMEGPKGEGRFRVYRSGIYDLLRDIERRGVLPVGTHFPPNPLPIE